MKDFNSRPEDYYSVGPNKQVIDIINDEIGDIGEYYFSVGNYIKYKERAGRKFTLTVEEVSKMYGDDVLKKYEETFGKDLGTSMTMQDYNKANYYHMNAFRLAQSIINDSYFIYNKDK